MTENSGQFDDDKPAAHLDEEPQSERGEPGSRDEGYPPGEGPSGRPAGTSDEESDTSVDPQGPIDPDMPVMPTGDQGG
ncbi:MAG: hypothetical protein M3313_09075 [Actinomycetota bacterium]|nr:hypothetical protein [Actinomycetota bacterium]